MQIFVTVQHRPDIDEIDECVMCVCVRLAHILKATFFFFLPFFKQSSVSNHASQECIYKTFGGTQQTWRTLSVGVLGGEWMLY